MPCHDAMTAKFECMQQQTSTSPKFIEAPVGALAVPLVSCRIKLKWNWQLDPVRMLVSTLFWSSQDSFWQTTHNDVPCPNPNSLLNKQHQCHMLHSSEFTLSEEFNSGSNGRRLTARAQPDPAEQDNQPFSPKSKPLSCPNPSWSIRIISQHQCQLLCWGSAHLQNPIPVRMLVLASNSLNTEIHLTLNPPPSISLSVSPDLECQRCKGAPAGPPVAPLGRRDHRTRLLSKCRPPAPAFLCVVVNQSINQSINPSIN
jgi:hypothetical protein